MRGRRGSKWVGSLALLALSGTLLGACSTSNIDHPITVGLPYPQAIEVIAGWCPTATIRVVPDALPGSIDPNLLFVAAEFYSAPVPSVTTTPPQDVPKLRAARLRPSQTHTSTTSPSTPDDSGSSTSVEPKPCDSSVPTTATLRLETPVPRLTELTVAAARTLLDERGLVLDVDAWSIPDDAVVLSQEPAPAARIRLDALPATTPVAVTVGIEVPDLRDLAEDVACSTVEAAGLVCDLLVTGRGPAPGRVTDQAPPPGDVVPPESAVRVSALREVAPVAVPSVLGEDPQLACRALDSVDLSCRLEGLAEPDLEPYVADQAPAPGDLVPVGTAIALTIATRSTRVPAVTGMTTEAACAAIVSAGLVCSALSGPRTGEPGHVAEQAPAADQIVRRQSVVTLDVPTGVTVPDVRDLTRDAACQALTDAGLRCGSGDAGGGTITRQDPPANSVVAEGTEVVLITFTEPSSGLPLWTIALATVVVVAIAVAGAQRVTRRLRRPPVVRVELGPIAVRVRVDQIAER
jgi:beta-lactam-binding protein with PASTA domain